MRLFLNALILFTTCISIKAQDAHFTQFNSTPIFLNPAMTGMFLNYYKGNESDQENNSRLILNTRNQWSGTPFSYSSVFVQYDKRILKQYGWASNNPLLENPFNLGVSCLYDQSLLGASKNTFLSLSSSYFLNLSEKTSTLGIGLSCSYSNRVFDVSKISFARQFSSGGFDLNLPSGEVALNNMKPYVSIGTGLLYRYKDDGSANFLNLGISAINVNKPKQTFFLDEKQYLPVRYTLEGNFSHIGLSSKIESYLFYQNQAAINEVMLGFVYDFFIPSSEDYERNIGLGFSYRHNDAISPYLRLEIKNLMIGFSYDITTSNLSKSSPPPKSFEISIQKLFKKNNE